MIPSAKPPYAFDPANYSQVRFMPTGSLSTLYGHFVNGHFISESNTLHKSAVRSWEYK